MKRFLLLLMGLIILTSTMCTRDKDVDKELIVKAVQILLTLKGPTYQGSFYPANLEVTTDFALWIEDANHDFVKTLKISPVAITVDSAHGSHIEHLPAWSAASGMSYEDLQQETADGIPPSFDGITGASPNFAADTAAQTITVTWDFTDTEGAAVASGIYYCYAEASNILKDGDSSTGTVTHFEIISETMNIKLDIGKATSEAGPATTNLTAMEASYETALVKSSGKSITGIQ